MMRRILLTLIVSLAAVVAVAHSASAAGPALAVDVLLDRTVIGLGEPVDLTIRVTNRSDTPFVTSQDALTIAWLWPHLEIARLLDDGTEEPVPTDAPLPTPAPPSRWIVRDGVAVAAATAVTLAPGDSVDLVLVNLVLYVPLADPGSYRASLAYEFPAYDETVTDPDYGAWPLVALGEEHRIAPACTPFAFELALDEGVRASDVEWFRRARGELFRSRSADEAASAFSPPDAVHYLEACGVYWTGEVYGLFGEFTSAAYAFGTVLEQFGDTRFAPYAQTRLDALAPTLAP